MSLQGHASWNPLDGGDLGYRPLDSLQDDTAYHGHSGDDSGVSSPLPPPYSEGYEMNDLNQQRSNISSAPLLHPSSPSIQKSSEDPSIHESVLTRSSRFRRQFSGWKVGVVVCAATATIVCLFNIILTIWAVSSHKLSGGISYLYIGSCSEVASMSLWIHLGINVMSTLLLSASNYTMQVISSPTRKEVDQAHKQFRWLDVGIPSTRNLRRISWARISMWCILALTSIPLHLMYNTAIFSSTTTNAYDYFVVSEEFLNAGAAYNKSVSISADKYGTALDLMHAAALSGSLTKKDSEDCMALYALNFVSKVRNVLLVTTDEDVSNRYLGAGNWNEYAEVSYNWLCGPGWSQYPYKEKEPLCTLSKAKAGASNWTVSGHPIDYSIMIVVIVANATKAAVMILTWRKFRTPTLVTIGDAIASFLDDPDPTTAGICLGTSEDIRKGKWKNLSAKPWVPKRQFWFKAPSIKRWLTCNILCWFFIFFGVFLLRRGMSNVGIYDISTLWKLGFGTVNPNALLGIMPSGLIAKVVFANLPQGILSFLYLTYNGLYSCMLSAYEWSLFAHSRQPVRVTVPVGKQQSTYYLQLPYYYAIPLLILSGTLHWLMSQSLFLVLIDIIDDTGNMDDGYSISAIGYSCISIFFAILVGSVAVTAGILNGFRRYSSGIPLVGSCSAAISAACHRPTDDSSASLLPLKWGSVDDDTSLEVGHCSLSSFDVTTPVNGQLYAGEHLKED